MFYFRIKHCCPKFILALKVSRVQYTVEQTPLMQTPLGPTQSVLVRGVFLFIYIRYVQDGMQCPHYSGCLYFRGVHKAGFHSLYMYIKCLLSKKLNYGFFITMLEVHVRYLFRIFLLTCGQLKDNLRRIPSSCTKETMPLTTLYMLLQILVISV